MTETEMKRIRAEQALAILDALEGLVVEFHAVHIVRDAHGIVVVRFEDQADDAAPERKAPEQHRGVRVRDALAQLTQAHAGES